MRQAIWGLVFGAATAGVAAAEAPKVVVDIAPLHSLVAQVMQGVGTPDLLIRPEVSPHHYKMRPSEAKALQDADVVFWIGHELTPKLEDTIPTVAPNAVAVEMMDAPGLIALGFRDTAVFKLDEDDHEDHHDDKEHDADDHADHDDHEEHAAHDDHADEHDDHKDEHGDHEEGHDDHGDEHDDHAHDHDGTDPHVWLDPQNGVAMIAAIADTLATVDPENASAYAANAKQAQADLEAMIDEIGAVLAPVADAPFVVFHDAYHYFEDRYGLSAAGAILVRDGSSPSASRLSEVRDAMKERGVVCVFSEPQFNPKLVKTVADGIDTKSIELDPIGVQQTLGATLYPDMLRALASDIASCLKD